MPDFELYIRGTRRPRTTPLAITITARGQISFSASAYRALGNPEAVVYLVDRDEQVIGFRPASADEPNAFRVTAGNRTATAVAVLGYMGVDYSVARRYPLLTDDEVPHIDLKQPGEPVTSNRRKN